MNESPRDETDYGSQTIISTVNKGQVKPSSSTQPEISMKNFLDFLATAYRLNDALENYPLETFKKSNSVDWSQLKSCTFVSVLFLNNIVDKHNQKKSYDRDQDSELKEEATDRTLSTLNGIPYDSFQMCELGNAERLGDECKPIVKQNVKRGEKHKRGRSASLGGSNLNSRAEKSKVDKRRSSFAKRENSESKNKSRNDISVAERQVKRKLSEVLQEGILDSVLPYVVPKQNANLSAKKTLSVGEKKNGHEKSSSSSSGQTKENISVYHSKKQNILMSDSSRELAKE